MSSHNNKYNYQIDSYKNSYIKICYDLKWKYV